MQACARLDPLTQAETADWGCGVTALPIGQQAAQLHLFSQLR